MRAIGGEHRLLRIRLIGHAVLIHFIAIAIPASTTASAATTTPTMAFTPFFGSSLRIYVIAFKRRTALWLQLRWALRLTLVLTWRLTLRRTWWLTLNWTARLILLRFVARDNG